MKRIVLYGLGALGVVSVLAGLWWLLGFATDEGYGPSFVLSIGILSRA